MIENKYYTIKNGFGFSDKHLYLIEYNDFNKKIIRNYDKIRTCMVNDLSKRHNVEYTDFRHMDFLVDDELYLKMMLFLDINQIGYLSNFIDVNSRYQDKMYFICFPEDEKYLTDLIKNCHTIIIDKSTIEEYLEKDYIELNGMKMYCPTE